MPEKKIMGMPNGNKLFIRKVLLSTGELTREAVIKYNNREYYDSVPRGITIGLKETQSEIAKNKVYVDSDLNKNIAILSQAEFDKKISKKFDSQTSAAFSLAYLKLLAYKNGFTEKEIFKYISQKYKTRSSAPQIICNILNGGKHTYNGLAFCEFMIIPRGVKTEQNIQIASEVYLDLKSIIKNELGKNHLLLGREGGFSPIISNVEDAISLLIKAINKRNKGKCFIAIDAAANNFTIQNHKKYFKYVVNETVYTTDTLVKYYSYFINKYPMIKYIEDPLHENDIRGWKFLLNKLGKKILIVADDLTVSKMYNLKKFKKYFNACVLKVNQSGNFTELIKAYNYCVKNNIKIVISQRSGETDSNIITHIATGLGSHYFKAGAPARERIIKYNELLRITQLILK